MSKLRQFTIFTGGIAKSLTTVADAVKMTNELSRTEHLVGTTGRQPPWSYLGPRKLRPSEIRYAHLLSRRSPYAPDEVGRWLAYYRPTLTIREFRSCVESCQAAYALPVAMDRKTPSADEAIRALEEFFARHGATKP